MMNKQAAAGIEKVFTSIGRFSKSLIKEFVQHLENYLNLEENEETLTDKLPILSSLKRRLPDKSFDTFEIIYGFIEIKLPRLRCLEKEAFDNSLLEIALTGVFEHQRTHRPPCNMNKLDQLYAARNIRIADKKKSGVYASLGVLLDKSVEEIKTKCIKYLKSKIFPLEQKEVKSILRENKTIDSHISDLESSDEGDPFIFYAASIVYQHHIHVLCAAEEGLEEYVFYPSELPSKRRSCGHKFIGHLSENNYFSLESTEQKFQKRDESEKLVREYQAKIEKLEKVIKDNKEKYLILSQEMKKNKEENLKLSIEMEKSKKENLRLSQEIEKSKKENLRLSQEMEKSKKENLRLSQEMEKSKKENLRLSQEMEKIKEEIMRYKQHVEVLEAKFKEVDSNFQLVNDKLDKLLSVQCAKCSLSNMSDSTNVKKAIDEDEKGKEDKQTNEKKSAQVANSAQNNNVRDEHNNVTNEHESAAKPKLSQNKAKHSGIGGQRDKTLPPVNYIERDPTVKQFQINSLSILRVIKQMK